MDLERGRCGHSVDFSNDNKVSYLTGMPDTLRTLYVARNRLGSLSSFDHLRGLEVLDLTGNLLESVSREYRTARPRFLADDRFGLLDKASAIDIGWE